MKQILKPKFVWLIPCIYSILFLFCVSIIKSFKIHSRSKDDVFDAIMYIIAQTDIKYHIILILIIIALYYLFYKSIEYHLEEEYIERRYILIYHIYKKLRYADIKEITLSRSPIARMFGIGAIKITTQATTEHSGFTIYSMSEYQEIYEYLAEQIKKAKNNK